MSTITQLVEVVHEFVLVINERGHIDVIYLDFFKAFDRVSHERLLNKQRATLNKGQISNGIQDYLSHRRQYVKLNATRFCLAHVSSGVPQGLVLGPLLFLIFLNDIQAGVPAKLRPFVHETTAERRHIKKTKILKKLGDCRWLVTNTSECCVFHVKRSLLLLRLS